MYRASIVQRGMWEMVTTDTYRSLEDERVLDVIPVVHEGLERGDAIESGGIMVCRE